MPSAAVFKTASNLARPLERGCLREHEDIKRDSMIARLCIIGVGLIGGSLARALRRAGACQEVVGIDREIASLNRALELRIIDRYCLDVETGVQGADMVVAAVPLGAMYPVFRGLVGRLSPGAVVTDVGSAKQSVIEAARRAFGVLPPTFVPGHPIAGTEQSGVEASCTELFEGRRVILTPEPETDSEALKRVRRLWERVGAEVQELNAKHHDHILAATSHLPHMLAYTLVDTLVGMGERAEIFRYAAGGFRDFTRIASSDPIMWRDIALANGEAIVAMLERFTDELGHLTRAVQAGDGAAIQAAFDRAKAARDRFVGLMDREGTRA
jgi:Prephenate dehydrogenase